jgi:hypothetical protein
MVITKLFWIIVTSSFFMFILGIKRLKGSI